MEFTFENFSKAGSGAVRINDLTVICGPNNSGKTYLNYAIHSILWDFLKLFDFGIEDEKLIDQIQKLRSDSEVHLDLSKTFLSIASIANNGYTIKGSTLYNYFQVNKEYFEDSKISLKLNEIDINKSITESGELFHGLIQYLYEFVDGKCILHLFWTKNKLRSDFSIENFLSEEKNIQYIIYSIKSLIFRNHFRDIVPWPFVITAERSGVALFYKSYDDKNSELLRSVENLEESFTMSRINNMKTKLFYPLELNIKDLRNFDILKDKKSIFVFYNNNEILDMFSKLIDDGSYDLLNDEIYYCPHVKTSDKESKIPLHAASSSIKSFFSLNLFVKHIADTHRMLIIDEPELSLYIDKQVIFARLVARLVNSGIKVLVTTHSDYFIRELNNLIAMNNLREDYKRKCMEEFKILDCDILDHSIVSAYKTDLEEDIQELKVSNLGIDPRNWNNSINFENYKFEKIYYSPKNTN